MLDLLFALIAIAAASQPPLAEQTAVVAAQPAAPAVVSSVIIGSAVQIGAGTVIEGEVAQQASSAEPSINEAVIPQGLVAEPQTPSGKFTTAVEVKPILTATKANWVALRDYDGNDLLYITHVWSWRCGLSALAVSVNDEPMQNWPLPPCHRYTAAPNAIIESDGLPYLKLKQGGVQSVTIQIVYDDLTRDAARFTRSDILMP